MTELIRQQTGLSFKVLCMVIHNIKSNNTEQTTKNNSNSLQTLHKISVAHICSHRK